MALVKPPLASVNPGQPVTAQSWNALVAGLRALYDAVLALGTGALEVSVTAQGQPVPGARVVAEPLSAPGNPILAVSPFGPHANFLVAGVSDGSWRVHVRAEGFNAEVRDVNVPGSSPLAIALTPTGKVVPDLFGLPGQQALTMLAGLGITLDLILDSTGQDVPRLSLPPTYQNSPVLFQLPAPGAVIDPATTRMRLVLAAAIQVEPTVTMPSLVGLTYDEAVTALSRIGLKVGKTQVRTVVRPVPPIR